MKKIIIASILMLAALATTFAQEKDSLIFRDSTGTETVEVVIDSADIKITVQDKDTNITTIKIKNNIITVKQIEDWTCDEKERIQKKRKRPAKYAGIGIHINGYVNQDFDFNTSNEASFMELDYAKSIGFQFNFFDTRIRMGDHFGVVLGMGFQFNQYRLLNNRQNINTRDSLFSDTINVPNYQKHKLKNTYLQVPLLLDFAPLHQEYRISAGITGGFLIAQKLKEEISNPEGLSKIKRKENLHFNPFLIHTTMEVGYQDISLYVNYSLSTLLQKNKGPELYPVSAGLRINF